MRVLLCSLCVLSVACGADRFESTGETPEPTDSAEGETAPESEDSEDPEKPVNVEVNVEVNVDGKPVASTSATNDTPPPEEDSGAIVITEPLTPLPIPTSYVPQELPEADAGDAGPVADAEPPGAVYEPVPAVVLDDAADTFRNWFLVGYNFDSQRLVREALPSGGYAAHATVTGNRDYTLTGVLFDGPSGEPRDAQDFDGVAFWVCGNIGALRFEVPTAQTKDAPQSFGALVDVTRQWQLVTVRWSDLGQDTPTHTFDVQSVRGLYFTVVFENYELWLHAVQFWTEGETLEGSSPTGSCL